MNTILFDLYSDYLLSSFGQTTATGLSRLLDGEVSHDQVTRMLSGKKLTPKTWWRMIKPHVRQIQSLDGILIFDDSIVEKPHTDENDIICWHYDHSKGKMVKGINFITALYYSQGIALPVSFEIVDKTEIYTDPKTGKEKRRSKITKNEYFRQMALRASQNQIEFRLILADIWFASTENMRFVKLDLGKDFIMGIKSNRLVARSTQDKANGLFQRIDELQIPEGPAVNVHMKGIPFPVQIVRQVFKNEDGSVGERYLVSSDLTLDADEIMTIYQTRWKVEEYHRSLKQNASLSKSPTKTETTQTNHFVASLWSFAKIELLKMRTKKNHYQLKSQLYLSALKEAFNALKRLNPISLQALSAA